ncbi:MAG TPA: hypothetical protein VH591_20710 [Ktedonobacterales bacterium]|jgi:hypothetical protein
MRQDGVAKYSVLARLAKEHAPPTEVITSPQNYTPGWWQPEILV